MFLSLSIFLFVRLLTDLLLIHVKLKVLFILILTSCSYLAQHIKHEDDSKNIIHLTSDNYSSKFRRSELAWEIYFLSSRGSPRIFNGSLHRLMPSISTLSEDENPNFSRPTMLVAACHVIRLFCTSPLKTSQATKT